MQKRREIPNGHVLKHLYSLDVQILKKLCKNMILGKSYKEKYVSKYAHLEGFRNVFASKLRVVANFEHPDNNDGKYFWGSVEGF